MIENLDEKSVFFSSDNFTLINGDTFELLKKVQEKSVDLIFADPPYFLSSGGISCSGGKQVSVNKASWDTSKSIQDKISYHREWIKLCRNVLKDDGSIWISSTLHSVYAIGVALEMEGYSIINNIIWEKPNPAPNLGCRSFTHSTETIIWARKINSKGKKGKHYFDYQKMKESNNGKQMKDVWRISEEEPLIWSIPTTPKKEKVQGKHPTQKPLELIKRIIISSTRENDVVLDPFSGSGTTGIACIILNRKYIGIENDLEYLNLSLSRFNALQNVLRNEGKQHERF